MQNITNKQRILKVKEILLKETDENNELSFECIIDRLKLEYGAGYEISIKAIKDDIKILRKSNIYLVENTNKYGKKMYSHQERLFETNELRILIDAISSSGSIGKSDKMKMISKIKKLTSKNMEQRLSNQIYSDFKVVNEDRTFRFNVDKIHTAIENKNKIEFKYGRYNLDKTFILSEKEYKVSPYNLVWENGFYYLVAYHEEKNKFINYRVDRIRNVNVLEEAHIKDIEFDLVKYLDSCFNMYPGDVEWISIKFDNHLINAIIDRFGLNINIKIEDEDNFILYTRAAINKGLIRWILNWGSNAQVISPQNLIDEMKEETTKMYEIYNKNKNRG